MNSMNEHKDLETIDLRGHQALNKNRRNLCDRHHQVIQKRIMVDLGLLKSGKVELRSPIDRGNLRKFLGIHCKKLPLIEENFFSTEMRIP